MNTLLIRTRRRAQAEFTSYMKEGHEVQDRRLQASLIWRARRLLKCESDHQRNFERQMLDMEIQKAEAMDYGLDPTQLDNQQLIWRRKRLEEKVLIAEARIAKRGPLPTLVEDKEAWEGLLKPTVEEILRRGLDSEDSYATP